MLKVNDEIKVIANGSMFTGKTAKIVEVRENGEPKYRVMIRFWSNNPNGYWFGSGEVEKLDDSSR